jgi:NAD(P)-dependent dehydrogenase (short-subunit alcohol dehydrogenase family)
MPATVTASTRPEPMPGLRGKGVLVTGGTSGIGQAIAVKFSEYGANVAINYLRQPDEATETAQQVQACVNRVQQHGVRDVIVHGDVSQEDDVVRMVAHAVEELGGIDVLINNAGIQISRHSDKLSSADFDMVLAVNLRGAFLCAREAIRHFLSADRAGEREPVGARATRQNDRAGQHHQAGAVNVTAVAMGARGAAIPDQSPGDCPRDREGHGRARAQGEAHAERDRPGTGTPAAVGAGRRPAAASDPAPSKRERPGGYVQRREHRCRGWGRGAGWSGSRSPGWWRSP